MAVASQKILDACFWGDVPALQMVFYEQDIRSNHPQSRFSLDPRVPKDAQLPYIELMLQTAIKGQNMEAISFLRNVFPDCRFDGTPMRAALDTENVQLLRYICKLDPAAANMEVGEQACVNALVYACSKQNAAELVQVLLEAGADPNRAPSEAIGIRCTIATAVIKGLPATTFEQFFDAGYQAHESNAINLAAQNNRPDVLSVLLARSVHLPDAKFPPKKKLLQTAKKHDNADMIAAIKWTYACRANRDKGTNPSCFSKLRCW